MSDFVLNNYYKCRIDKIVDIQDVEYFVLIDENNKKHLLETVYFKNYNLEIGKTYDFRVDKINCKGKIFFEPENPFYQIGKNYNFYFQKKEKRINKHNTEEFFFIFSGKNETVAEIQTDLVNFENIKFLKNQEIKACVDRIKKGKLIISNNI